jgi:hypothetical protein
VSERLSNEPCYDAGSLGSTFSTAMPTSRARFLVLALFVLMMSVPAPTQSGIGTPGASVGRAEIEAFGDYPFLRPDVDAHYLSSFDRTGGNDDGFAGNYSALYVDTSGEHVIFDSKGPGAVYTIWFTSRENGWAPLGWGRIKFYFDDETAPRLAIDGDELFSGKTKPFVAPFVFNAFASTGGYVCYMPFPYKTRLKITTERRVGFYNIYSHSYSPDRGVESWTGREAYTAIAALWNASGVNPLGSLEGDVASGTIDLPAPALPDGEPVPSVTRMFERPGTGAITGLRVNPLFPLTQYELNHIIIRMYWDGQTEPSVSVPLGSFFGSGLGEAPVGAVPLGMTSAGAYYCYLPMPFWKSARIELVNENTNSTPKIWWEVRVTPSSSREYPQDRCGYFNAQYKREWPTTNGVDYGILDTRGRGIFVGQVMTVEPVRPEIKRWWEGDLRIYLDGRRQPSFHGTGHEDEYLGGWSNEWLMNPYSLPMHGEPVTRDLKAIDFQWNASTSVYRFFVGGVPYQSRIIVSTEHGVNNEVPAMYSSVAYYYEQAGGSRVLDRLDVGNADDEKRHRYRTELASTVKRLDAQFEGAHDRESVTDDGREVAGVSRFSITIPSGASELRLRRLYDQTSPQDAEIWINGKAAGLWYTPAVNPSKRWAESDFMIPAALVSGSTLDVEVRVRQGTWNEYRYELWGRSKN